MENQQDDLDIKRSNAHAQTNANDICNHLRQLEQSGHGAAGRWIWELLQNARDVAHPGTPQTVAFALTGESLTYTHHGRGFTEDEVIRLIDHGTTKLHEVGVAGKFGTGFMSTHLISRRVQISGPLDEDRYFDFLLSREGATGEEMFKSLETSYKGFKASRRENSERVTASSFKYIFSNGKYESTKLGLANALKFLSLVLVLNEEFAEIKITIDGVETILTTNQETFEGDQYNNESRQTVTIQAGKGEPEPHAYLLARKRFSFDGKVLTPLEFVVEGVAPMEVAIDVAVKVDDEGIVLDAAMPVFFLYFPLISTERFGLPFVINSRQFFPRTERDGLPLVAGENRPDVFLNRLIIEKGFQTFVELVERFGKRGGGSVLNAFDFGPCPDFDDLDQEWFKSAIVDALKSISKLKLIASDDADQNYSFQDLWIPIEEDPKANQLVWEVAAAIDGIVLPPKMELEHFKAIVTGRPELFSIEFWGGKVQTLTLKDIAHRIDQTNGGELHALARGLRGDKDHNAVIEWLQNFVNACIQTDQEVLLSRYKILPRKDLKLAKSDSNLEIDGFLDEELLDLYKLLCSLELRERLLLDGFEVPKGLLKVREMDEVLIKLLQHAKSDASKYSNSEFESNPITKLLLWIVRKERWDSLDGYPFYTKSDKTPIIYWKSDLVLIAPSPLWEEGWSAFEELFPTEFMVVDEYGPVVAGLEAVIQSHGIWKTSFVTQENLKLNTVEVKKVAMIAEETETSHVVELENVCNVLFFESPADQSMMEKAKQSKKRTGLLIDLIFTKLIALESKWDEMVELPCTCGAKHIVPQSRMLYKLKTLQWANLNQDPNLPSVENFLPHFAERRSLEVVLGIDRATALLALIGVSPSELLKRIKTRSNPDLDRQWEGTMMAMMRSSHDPLALREAISDPSFVQEFREKQRLQGRARINQELGADVETLFKQALKEAGANLSHVKILRTPYGADFTLVDQADYIGGYEISAGAARLIVEIKATGTEWASMTPLQAKTARDRADEYVLVVLPLYGEDLDVEVFKRNALFVRGIGAVLKSRVDSLEAFNAMATNENDLWMDNQGGQVRFKVGPRIWRQGEDFASFVERVKEVLMKGGIG